MPTVCSSLRLKPSVVNALCRHAPCPVIGQPQHIAASRRGLRLAPPRPAPLAAAPRRRDGAWRRPGPRRSPKPRAGAPPPAGAARRPAGLRGVGARISCSARFLRSFDGIVRIKGHHCARFDSLNVPKILFIWFASNGPVPTVCSSLRLSSMLSVD